MVHQLFNLAIISNKLHLQSIRYPTNMYGCTELYRLFQLQTETSWITTGSKHVSAKETTDISNVNTALTMDCRTACWRRYYCALTLLLVVTPRCIIKYGHNVTTTTLSLYAYHSQDEHSDSEGPIVFRISRRGCSAKQMFNRKFEKTVFSRLQRGRHKAMASTLTATFWLFKTLGWLPTISNMVRERPQQKIQLVKD